MTARAFVRILVVHPSIHLPMGDLEIIVRLLRVVRFICVARSKPTVVADNSLVEALGPSKDTLTEGCALLRLRVITKCKVEAIASLTEGGNGDF